MTILGVWKPAEPVRPFGQVAIVTGSSRGIGRLIIKARRGRGAS
jgi:hypothetical protein